MEYSLEYFVEKFSKIPDDKWALKSQVKVDEKTKEITCCALGHCIPEGSRKMYPIVTAYDFEEGRALRKLANENLDKNGYIITVVNNQATSRYQQNTPKARVLAFLNDLIKIRDGIHA